MKYKKKLKSLLTYGISFLFGSILANAVIPYILSKDTSKAVFNIVCSFIAIVICSVERFIAEVRKSKK